MQTAKKNPERISKQLVVELSNGVYITIIPHCTDDDDVKFVKNALRDKGVTTLTYNNMTRRYAKLLLPPRPIKDRNVMQLLRCVLEWMCVNRFSRPLDEEKDLLHVLEDESCTHAHTPGRDVRIYEELDITVKLLICRYMNTHGRNEIRNISGIWERCLMARLEGLSIRRDIAAIGRPIGAQQKHEVKRLHRLMCSLDSDVAAYVEHARSSMDGHDPRSRLSAHLTELRNDAGDETTKQALQYAIDTYWRF